MNWRKARRITWLVWCGLWAATWLAGAGQAFIDWGEYNQPGAGFDMALDLALFVGSLAAMRVPLGKPAKV